VRKTALTKKLSDVMPTVTVDVAAASRNAHAKAVTEAKMQDDALALIKNGSTANCRHIASGRRGDPA
jgi:hypothetical protein